MIFKIILLILLIGPILIFSIALVFKIVESGYIFIYSRPLYLYFYPFPKKLKSQYRLILQNEFPFYRRLPDRRKVYFEHRVSCFLKNYQFIGKDIEITAEMMIIIAGTYVMLTFGMRQYIIQQFTKIIIYPRQYFSTINETYHKGEFNPRLKAVVFSWEDFLLGLQTSNDNINLGLHEFSHVLHFHTMKSNDPSAIIFYDEFDEIVKFYKNEQLFSELVSKKYFRDYAFENQFEFLAVILEHFFESPEIFRREFPELYERVRKMINFK
ncbi:zinc-dependent peptidase [Flavobacterium qiangtangense]|uniref:Zinc-dependent peptidase n=1 Tax=Flavobacterium qiangtangense TaxID=1442595 RepID=A0ABW1PPN8_9FLAO